MVCEKQQKLDHSKNYQIYVEWLQYISGIKFYMVKGSQGTFWYSDETIKIVSVSFGLGKINISKNSSHFHFTVSYVSKFIVTSRWLEDKYDQLEKGAYFEFEIGLFRALVVLMTLNLL